MLNNKPELFIVIWGYISLESEEEVKLQETWEGTNAEKDPLGLLILIREKHVEGRFPTKWRQDYQQDENIILDSNFVFIH